MPTKRKPQRTLEQGGTGWADRPRPPHRARNGQFRARPAMERVCEKCGGLVDETVLFYHEGVSRVRRACLACGKVEVVTREDLSCPQ